MRITIINIICVLLLIATVSCKQSGKPLDERKESREAKVLMQGLWVDEESEEVFFKMEGDSVYYPDSLILPSRFRIIDDSLYIGTSGSYYIVKQTEHVLWFKNHNGEIVKLKKSDEKGDEEETYTAPIRPIVQLKNVLKKDTVVFLDGQRYHCYIAINPTRYKVIRTSYNEDGLQVDQVYYDNIIHVSVFQSNRQLFSHDLRKQFYQKSVPDDFLQQAILNDMSFDHVDEQGFHFNATLCMPDAASCYMVDNIVSTDGLLSTKLIEY